MKTRVSLKYFVTIVEVTFDICANVLFEINERAEGLSWIEFKELLSVATKKSYFIFNKKL